MSSNKFPFWFFGVLLNLNSVSSSDCAKWVEAAYRAGANYCVLELAKSTSDELIAEFAVSCRKRNMYVGFFCRCFDANYVRHILSSFGRVDYLMLEEESDYQCNDEEANQHFETTSDIYKELKELIYSVAPHIYLRGPKELEPSVSSVKELSREESPRYFNRGVYSEDEGRESWQEFDYTMLDTKPWHEEELVVRSAEMIAGVYEGVIADGMNFLLHVSVLRTHSHYGAQLKSLRDLGLRIAPKRRKLQIPVGVWVSIVIAVTLIFCFARSLYVNEVYGKYQRMLVGFQSRVVSAPVGEYYYSISSPSFPLFRSESAGLHYYINGPLMKIKDYSVDIHVTVIPYLNKPCKIYIDIAEVPNSIVSEEPASDWNYYYLSLDSELNPTPDSDAAACSAFEKYREYVCKQILAGNDFFEIE